MAKQQKASLYCYNHPDVPAQCLHMALCRGCRCPLPFDCNCSKGDPRPNIIQVLNDEADKVNLKVVDLQKETPKEAIKEEPKQEIKEHEIIHEEEDDDKPPPLIRMNTKIYVPEDAEVKKCLEEARLTFEQELKKQEEREKLLNEKIEEIKRLNEVIDVLKENDKFKDFVIETLRTEKHDLQEKIDELMVHKQLSLYSEVRDTYNNKLKLDMMKQEVELKERIEQETRQQNEQITLKLVDLDNLMSKLQEIPKQTNDYDSKPNLPEIPEEPKKKENDAKPKKIKKKLKNHGTMDRLEKLYLQGKNEQLRKTLNQNRGSGDH